MIWFCCRSQPLKPHGFIWIPRLYQILRRKIFGYIIILIWAAYMVVCINLMKDYSAIEKDYRYSYSHFAYGLAKSTIHEKHIDETWNSSSALSRWYLADASAPGTSLIRKNTVQRVWPEMLPHDDRMENQLLFRPNKTVTKTKLILLVDTSRSKLKQLPIGRSLFTRNKCPVYQCLITYDVTKAGKADSILFNDKVTTEFLEVPSLVPAR